MQKCWKLFSDENTWGQKSENSNLPNLPNFPTCRIRLLRPLSCSAANSKHFLLRSLFRSDDFPNVMCATFCFWAKNAAVCMSLQNGMKYCIGTKLNPIITCSFTCRFQKYLVRRNRSIGTFFRSIFNFLAILRRTFSFRAFGFS